MSKRSDLILACFIGLFVIAIRAPLMDLPLERDEGEYAYIAWRMSLGEIPYLDWFNQKPPGVFFAYRLALGFAGDAAVAIRGLAAVFSAVTSIGVFVLARGMLGTGAALISALIFALLSADPMIQGSIANTELFMLPGIVWAAWLTLRAIDSGKAGARASLAVGVLIGIAIAFKQVAVLNVPFFLLIFGMRVRGESRWSELVKFTAWMALGVTLVWGPIVFWLYLRGALGAAVDAAFLHNLSYAGALSFPRRLDLLIAYATSFARSQGITWLLAGVGFAILTRRQNRFAAWFLGGWAAVSAAGVSVSGHYFPHYFQQLLPAVAILAGAAIWGVKNGAGYSRWRVWLLGVLAVAPLAFAAVPLWTLSPPAAIKRIYPHNAFDEMPALAREIESITDEDDRVFIFGAEPEVLFYAHRASASRYIFLFPVFGPFSDALERQRSVISEVSSVRPAVMVWMPNLMFFKKGVPQELTDWFRGFSASDYRIHAFRIRRSDGGGALLRVPRGVDPMAVLRGQSPSATIFIRSDLLHTSRKTESQRVSE